MDEKLAYLIAKEEIIDRINQLFIATDNGDWKWVRSCLTDQVLFDMSSMTGQKETIVSADEIVDSWRTGLSLLQAVHHQAGNYRVNLAGETAEAFCYGIASHFLANRSGKNTRTFVGSYNIGLKKQNGEWVIDRFRFNLKYIEGNLNLESEA